MKKENTKKCDCSRKIIVPKGKLGSYCSMLDRFTNTCKIDGDSKYFYLYYLNGGNGCPKLR